VSRQLLKKFASDKYRLAATPANISHLNHAISHGAEKGIFLLPKGLLYALPILSIVTDTITLGPSGRVKLSAAGKAARTGDEVTCL
jgi:hypothetical protein